MKIAVLWSHTSGYLNAGLRALASSGSDIYLNYFRAASSAPFSDDAFSWLGDDALSEHESAAEFESLLRRLNDFSPDALVISGWHHPIYREVAKYYKGRAVRVLCMDNPWQERVKQWAGRLISPLFIKPMFDLVTVPGERQAQFAKRLGFTQRQMVRGLFACDYDKFSLASVPVDQRDLGFAYIGRLAPEKGISSLVEAYRRYRDTCSAPWTLTIYGTGTQVDLLANQPGILVSGFVQPNDLPSLIARHKCLLVPSLAEPWGVQVHEGAAAGLPIICTAACGSSVHFVVDGFNGYVVDPGDALGFARAMIAVEANLESFSQASFALAAQSTPTIWASNLVRAIAHQGKMGT